MTSDYTLSDHLKALKLDVLNTECFIGYLKQRVLEMEKMINEKPKGDGCSL